MWFSEKQLGYWSDQNFEMFLGEIKKQAELQLEEL